MEDYTELVKIYCEQVSINEGMMMALTERHKQEVILEIKRSSRGFPNNPFDACEQKIGRKLSHEEIETLAEILRNRCESK